MLRTVYALLLCLALAGQGLAEVKIDQKHRVANKSPGYCAWACIGTLAKHNCVVCLSDIMDKRSKMTIKTWNGYEYVQEPCVWVKYGDGPGSYWVKEKRNIGTDWGIYRAMEKSGARYYLQNTGKFSTSLIKYAMDHDLGCAVAFKAGAVGKSAHAVTLVHYDDEVVKYIDPNDPEWTYVATRAWFDTNWSGWVLVLDRPTDKKDCPDNDEELQEQP